MMHPPHWRLMDEYPEFYVFKGHDILAMPDKFSDFRADLRAEGTLVLLAGAPAVVATPDGDWTVVVPLHCSDYDTGDDPAPPPPVPSFDDTGDEAR